MKIFITLITLVTVSLRAEITFEMTKQEITATPDATTVYADFSFTNHGDKIEEIARYEATCSCMTVQMNNGEKMKFAPGEKGSLRATFQLENFSGDVDKSLLLWMKGDAESAPSHQLTVRVHIPVLVVLEPKTVEWKSGEALSAKIIKVTMKHTEPIHLLSVTMSNPAYASKLITVTEGSEYNLEVTPKPNGHDQVGMGVMHLDTDCKIEKQKKQMAFAIVRQAATVSEPPAILGPAPRVEAEKISK